MDRKISASSPTSTKPPSVASLAISRKSRGGSLYEERRSMSMKDVLVWKKITRRWHDRVMERQNRGFCWWDHDQRKKRGKLNVEKEPTYRMEPVSVPPISELNEIIKCHLEESLDTKAYSEDDSNLAKQITMKLADEIKDKLKNSASWPNRYKCIVYVTMGQKKGQGVRVSSRCAWDASFDRSISYTYQNENLFCVVTVFAVYCE